jgi:hypothetical protein
MGFGITMRLWSSIVWLIEGTHKVAPESRCLLEPEGEKFADKVEQKTLKSIFTSQFVY